MSKTAVYFVPGLAASTTIFENIKLPEKDYEMYFIDWILPKINESISSYAKRMCKSIKYENIILIGVSFGGVIVQEMEKHCVAKQVIIISSVKCNQELPIHLKFAKSTKIYKILPTSLLGKIENYSQYFNEKSVISKRLKLYSKYLYMHQTKYLDWAIENILQWKQSEPNKNVIHIHGDNDMIFPIKNIQNCIVVKGGTHIMIINKYKWLNENLPKIIKSEKLIN